MSLAARRRLADVARQALLQQPCLGVSVSGSCSGAGQWLGHGLAQPLLCLSHCRGIKRQANEVRPGNVLERGGRLLQVVKSSYTQGAGRQLGNVQLELRDVLSKARSVERKRPYDTVEVAFVEERAMQFLYREGTTLHLMDPSTYEQVALPEELFGPPARFLAEGAPAAVSFHNDDAIAGSVPDKATLRVAETAPYAKGDSASHSLKEAVCEGGARVMVPPYITEGEAVVVDTRDGSFVKRVAVE